MAKFFNKILDYISMDETDDQETVANNDYDPAERELEYEEPTKGFRKKKDNKVVSIYQNGGTSNIIIYRPVSCDEAQTMIDSLKSKKPVVANIENIDHEKAQRILDIMSGAMYAIGGSVHKITSGIYIFAPDGVDVTGNVRGDAKNSSSFFASFSSQSNR